MQELVACPIRKASSNFASTYNHQGCIYTMLKTIVRGGWLWEKMKMKEKKKKKGKEKGEIASFASRERKLISKGGGK